jgi:diguanylate cyclase (GGDEF)-like protein
VTVFHKYWHLKDAKILRVFFAKVLSVTAAFDSDTTLPRLKRLHFLDLLVLIAIAAMCAFVLWRGWVSSEELSAEYQRSKEMIGLAEQSLVLTAKSEAAHHTEALWIYTLMSNKTQRERLDLASDAFILAQNEFQSALNGLTALVPAQSWHQELLGILQREHTSFVKLHEQIYKTAKSGDASKFQEAKEMLADDGLRLSESVSALTQTIALNFSREARLIQERSTQHIQTLRWRLALVIAAALALTALLGWLMQSAWQSTQGALSHLQALALTDSLTRLPNRRAFRARLREEIARARRSGTPFVLSVLDVDHFKQFNDAHGHPKGDVFLKEAAQAWRKALRPTDFLARVGGEEFAVLLVNCPAEEAGVLLNRLREATPMDQTLSAGTATFGYDDTAHTLYKRADDALLRAKREGRNRVLDDTLPMDFVPTAVPA